MRLNSKVAIVTGAARGIGQATAKRFVEEGAKVVLADLNTQLGEETAKQLRIEFGAEVYFVHTDVAKSTDVQELVKFTVDKFGYLNVLFNGAGILIPDTVVDTSEEVWDKTINVNLKSVYLTCKYAIPEMINKGEGSIINVGSVNSLVAEPFLPAYCASKGGVLMLTRQVALDYAQQHIRANCICPGWVDTSINDPHAERMGGREKVLSTIADWQPMGRQGRPEEIGNVAVFLASDESSFMTGSAVVADGGMTAK